MSLLVVFSLFFYIQSHATTNYCPKWNDKTSISTILKEIANNKAIKSVEDVICRLPSSVLDNYSLVGKSASAQGSSLRHPRVILFKQGRRSLIDYLLSFNGNSEDSNYLHVEVLKINRGRNVDTPLEFIDVSFDHEENGQRVLISKPNPQKCMQCHGIHHEPRPIWDAECFFPTSYNRMKLTTGDSIPRITNDLSKFLNDIRDQPRYLPLKALNKSVSKVQLELTEHNNLIYRDLADINLDRVTRLVSDTPNYRNFRFAILASLIGCDDMDSFVTESWHEYIENNHINIDFDGANTTIRKYLRDSERKVDPITWSCTRLNVAAIANFRWIIEGRGISMEEWAMDTPKLGKFGFYRFLGSGLGPEAIASRLVKQDGGLRALLANHFSGREIKHFYGNYPELAFEREGTDKLPRICSTLKKKSLRNLSLSKPSAKNSLPAKGKSKRVPSNSKKSKPVNKKK